MPTSNDDDARTVMPAQASCRRESVITAANARVNNVGPKMPARLDRLDRALQPALFGRIDLARHHGLRGGSGDAPQRGDRHRRPEPGRARRKPIQRKPSVPKTRPNSSVRRSPMRGTILRSGRPARSRAARRRSGQRVADHLRAPAEAIVRVQHERARIDHVRERPSGTARRQPEHLRIAAQQHQRAERIGCASSRSAACAVPSAAIRAARKSRSRNSSAPARPRPRTAGADRSRRGIRRARAR